MSSIENGDRAIAVEGRVVRGHVVAFVALLLLALIWPAPVIWINDATLRLPLRIGERSFLGREAPEWDVAYWSIAVLYALALAHGRLGALARGGRRAVRDLRGFPAVAAARFRRIMPLRAVLLTAASLVVVASVWLLLDSRLVALAEGARTSDSRAIASLFNRLGGGANPPLIVLFFAVAGMVFGLRRWWLLAMAMAAAGVSGGIVVQLVKRVVERSRPEAWLGPFHFESPSSSSFPSGHTIAVFAIAAVIALGMRSRVLGVVAALLAVGVATARVMAFRHWPSDVLASALIGVGLGWFFVSVVLLMEEERNDAT